MNVTIVDAVDVNRNTVQLPIAVAANVCDVDINVLAADLADDGRANCTAEAVTQITGSSSLCSLVNGY